MRESKSRALPLGYTPLNHLAGVVGFEPTNVGVRVQCLTAWRHPIISNPQSNGAPEEIRTPDLCLRRALLYPAELLVQVERVKGIGPSQPAWKAGALPLSYTRINMLTYISTLDLLCQQKN